MRILVDSGSTGNYSVAQECVVKKLQIQNEEVAEELRLVDGSTVKKDGGASPSPCQVQRIQRNYLCPGIPQNEQTNDTRNPVAVQRKSAY